ncbi:hypothetical protein TIFTF001_028344 [Ficus carica]|uniref:Uncharacterized protein n=1 Tax=Ficus carica TaxID=3494 RepID=A0AA88J1J4_FICCA|nr:hypothetical protein TIFTF001_028344 [Ficus carica]
MEVEVGFWNDGWVSGFGIRIGVKFDGIGVRTKVEVGFHDGVEIGIKNRFREGGGRLESGFEIGLMSVFRARVE